MSAQLYAPDYLRAQKDEELHLIANMIEEQSDQIVALKAVVNRYLQRAEYDWNREFMEALAPRPTRQVPIPCGSAGDK